MGACLRPDDPRLYSTMAVRDMAIVPNAVQSRTQVIVPPARKLIHSYAVFISCSALFSALWLGEGTAMQSVLHVATWGAVELAKANRQVRITNALIELQRQLLEHLDQAGDDLTSANIVFDSLLVSLSWCVEHRHRLRATVTAHTAA
jgi:hypothetical protein